MTKERIIGSKLPSGRVVPMAVEASVCTQIKRGLDRLIGRKLKYNRGLYTGQTHDDAYRVMLNHQYATPEKRMEDLKRLLGWIEEEVEAINPTGKGKRA